MTAQEWLANSSDEVDVVVNLTGEPSESIFRICRQHHLDYIDTGLELAEDDERTLDTAFNELRSTQSAVRALMGFGMNPGLVEYIYHLCAPRGEHIAVELEYDTATWEERQIFNTWSPVSYFKESMIYDPYVYSRKDGVRLLPPPGIKIESRLNVDGITRVFDLIPHEEVLSMGMSVKNCRFCAFLYQAPLAMQQYLKNSGHLDPEMMGNIHVPYTGLEGEDTIGMLIHDGSSRLMYHFNRASHSECITKFKDGDGRGVNATSWQVACGVYVALEILPSLRPGIYTMTDAASEFSPQIETALQEVGFDIESRELREAALDWGNSLLPLVQDTAVPFRARL